MAFKLKTIHSVAQSIKTKTPFKLHQSSQSIQDAIKMLLRDNQQPTLIFVIVLVVVGCVCLKQTAERQTDETRRAAAHDRRQSGESRQAGESADGVCQARPMDQPAISQGV